MNPLNWPVSCYQAQAYANAHVTLINTNVSFIDIIQNKSSKDLQNHKTEYFLIPLWLFVQSRATVYV
jgi:hypothetical protein